MEVAIKSSYNGDVRRFSFTLEDEEAPDTTGVTEFRSLCAILARIYRIRRLRLMYLDNENDLISICSDIELRHAIHHAANLQSDGLLRLQVHPPKTERPAPQTAAPVQAEKRVKRGRRMNHPVKELQVLDEEPGSESEPAPSPRVDSESEGAAAVDAGTEPNANTRFDVHEGVECTECHMEPLMGVRHWCVSRPAVSLCDFCRSKAASDLDALSWRRIAFPWLVEDPTRLVPRAPLQLGDGSNDVKLLQYILIKLGYLRDEHVDKLVGWFQGHTAQAVANFRANYGINADSESAEYVYDESVAGALSNVIITTL